VFAVSLSAPSGQTIRLNYLTANGTALAGVDYAATNGTLVFGPGQTKTNIVVSVLDNFPRRTAKTFDVQLTSPVNAALADGTGVGTIASEPWPEIRIADVRVKEGSSGWADAGFKVSLSMASARTFSVDYATTNGTAVAGTDYRESRGTLTLLPGVTNATIAVPIQGNLLNEPDKAFRILLSNATNADITLGQATCTIENDDLEPTLLVAPSMVTKPKSGFTNMVFLVLLSAPSGQEVTVNYSTSDGTAIRGQDYVGTNGLLTFSAGQTRKSIIVAAIGNATPEPDKVFYVTLVDPPTHARIITGQGKATGTIHSSAVLPSLTISDGSCKEPAAGSTNVSLTVRLSSPSTDWVTVEFQTTTGTALAGRDYVAAASTLSFPPGTTSTNLQIQILADGTSDGDKVFYVQLRNPSNAAIDDATGQVTILGSGAVEEVLILGIRRTGIKAFELYLTGKTSQAIRVQASLNLLDWEVITNTTSTGWTMALPEIQPNYPRRFYRAVSP
jgi:hypothetical protein